jgi:hypothetical protein
LCWLARKECCSTCERAHWHTPIPHAHMPARSTPSSHAKKRTDGHPPALTTDIVEPIAHPSINTPRGDAHGFDTAHTDHIAMMKSMVKVIWVAAMAVVVVPMGADAQTAPAVTVNLSEQSDCRAQLPHYQCCCPSYAASPQRAAIHTQSTRVRARLVTAQIRILRLNEATPCQSPLPPSARSKT